eukprot:scaffold2907_cov112-Isochrysis_galbana.AAC.6
MFCDRPYMTLLSHPCPDISPLHRVDEARGRGRVRLAHRQKTKRAGASAPVGAAAVEDARGIECNTPPRHGDGELAARLPLLYCAQDGARVAGGGVGAVAAGHNHE